MMVDYASKLTLHGLLLILNSATRLTHVRYVVLSWGGSCFIVSCLEHVSNHLKSIVDGKSRPMMIDFGSGSPQWMMGGSAKEDLSLSLSPLLHALASHQELPPQAPTIPVINLESLHNLPLMPTLNGILLGYPAIYHVTSAEESQKSARDLSTEALTLFRVLSEEMIVSSFSMPSRLIPEGKSDPFWTCIANWSKTLIRAIGDGRFEQKEVGMVSVSL